MNRKTKFIVISILFIFPILSTASITFGQRSWNYCKIDAYGTNLNDYSDSSTNQERYAFTVATPPAGSDITNTIEVADFGTGENFTENLSPGEVVYFNYQYTNFEINNVTAAGSGFWTIEYLGDITEITINNVEIPEFSSIIILPLFIAATLLAIIYRKKRGIQKQITN